jgi:uncharacterized membrane protein YozB (DUF420 family)
VADSAARDQQLAARTAGQPSHRIASHRIASHRIASKWESPHEARLDLSLLPAINASLNGLAMLLLIVGRVLIHHKRIDAHRRVMIGAFSSSTLFLGLYVLHKASRGFESLSYNATGAPKTAYLIILFSHLTLAMIVPVLAIALLRYGLTNRISSHRRLARVAWPIWMYVSVTGILIYLALYQLNPPA